MDTYNFSDVYPFYDKMCKILIGASTYGDDGIDAVITNFYVSSDGIPMIRFRQEDGISYDFSLEEYLDNIDLEDDDYNEVKEMLETFDDDYLQESLSNTTKKKDKQHKRKLILDEEVVPQKYNTRKDWRHKR